MKLSIWVDYPIPDVPSRRFMTSSFAFARNLKYNLYQWCPHDLLLAKHQHVFKDSVTYTDES